MVELGSRHRVNTSRALALSILCLSVAVAFFFFLQNASAHSSITIAVGSGCVLVVPLHSEERREAPRWRVCVRVQGPMRTCACARGPASSRGHCQTSTRLFWSMIPPPTHTTPHWPGTAGLRPPRPMSCRPVGVLPPDQNSPVNTQRTP